jgi:hypothetical protein
MIKMSINLFNDQLIKCNSNLRFKAAYDEYALKPSKKDGKPKTDMPSNFYLFYTK